MRPFASLRRRADFARVRARGRRVSSPWFTLYSADPAAYDLQPLVGISVSKAVGGAVVRNRVRRRIAGALTEIFREREQRRRIVIVVRPEAAQAEFAQLRARLAGALR